ncbi:hypothetical protein ACIQU6_34225 [Streptomyces sp. NPDC090442]|uniref:hypothetical protein n=1 Tax=Streptomyces sp. NPDC090442 TaxID=3365962 RepID=UPI00380F9E57
MTADSNAMPDPDDFAAYLSSLESVNGGMREDAYRSAVNEAISVIKHAGKVRKSAVEAGFSPETSESMALDFWNIASGLGVE